MRSEAERFFEKVNRIDGACWDWLAGRTKDGYGEFRARRTRLAHQWIYERHYGPLPYGLQIDHRCGNRGCVRPEHLRAVTCRENLLSGATWAAFNAAKEACVRGHELAGLNVYWRGNRRMCRPCQKTRDRVWAAKRGRLGRCPLDLAAFLGAW